MERKILQQQQRENDEVIQKTVTSSYSCWRWFWKLPNRGVYLVFSRTLSKLSFSLYIKQIIKFPPLQIITEIKPFTSLYNYPSSQEQLHLDCYNSLYFGPSQVNQPPPAHPKMLLWGFYQITGDRMLITPTAASLSVSLWVKESIFRFCW